MKIKANGIQINYVLSGKKGAPVVMLSHSLGSSLEMWDPQMPALEPHFRVLRYDTRGHGESDTPEGPYSLEQLGADAVGFMDALDIERVHWVGLSMGGMIGQCIALNYPDRLITLALCDTAAVMPPESKQIRQERIDIARSQGMAALAQSTMERWFTEPYLKQNPPQVERIRNIFLKTPVAGYVGCMEAIDQLNYLERLSEINKPTLIIVGEEDLGTPVSASKSMDERISDSTLVMLKSAAHLSNVEQAEAFNDALIRFLLSHRS
ncbi:MAG: 3-oxoadipate enol-lactonase [Deltaproteobacteria bacterium]|nr:3-oxoadipate enol-lactonase [Deltaproteobacteria bacterium]MBW2154164.1 3-oxoadipate enol-lactonase [Deltaproteobacteria bacterium]